jgi:inorganic pyrophosphatase
VHTIFSLAALLLAAAVAWPGPPPLILPAAATTQLVRSLDASTPHRSHVWRDTVPLNADGTVNAYIEIPRGERRKFELDMANNVRFIDRVMPEALGGYPVNYGFVPQTVSYDGDPFDALVLGPPARGGSLVRGVIVGLMHMEDEKGVDSKVVLSATGSDGRPIHLLTAADKRRIGRYFDRYKRHEPGKFSRVPGWDSMTRGLAYVRVTHQFFLECRRKPGSNCEVPVTRTPQP